MLARFLSLVLMCAASAGAATIRVTIRNLAPAGGTFLTPFWVGFNNGTFDLYDLGAPASLAIERVAEDGDTAELMMDFAASGAGTAQATIPGPAGPFAPGESTAVDFTVDPADPMSRYFSYASMIIPSNDAFIANGNPLAFQIFDAGGNFLGANFVVLGSMVNDAGTEVNDEVPANTAFFGQMTPNTGVTEGGVVMIHGGFLPPGSGGILDSPMFANADFTAPGYQAARISVELVPEPSTVMLVGAGLLWVAARRQAMRRHLRSSLRTGRRDVSHVV
jgi:hypothetical protein